jgi:hypothetical protein
MAKPRGMTFKPTRQAGLVGGALVGPANLASRRYVMIDDGPGFSLVPWQPVLDQHIGQQIAGIARKAGIEWTFGRKRGLGL